MRICNIAFSVGSFPIGEKEWRFDDADPLAYAYLECANGDFRIGRHGSAIEIGPQLV